MILDVVSNIKGEGIAGTFYKKRTVKNKSGVNTSKFAKKVDLANLKSNVDKLDIDKLKTKNFKKVK